MRYAVLAWLLAGLTAALGVQAPATAALTAAAPTATGGVRTPPPPRKVAPKPIGYTLLCLGDSITAGTASSDGTGYRAPLHALALTARFVGLQGTAPLQHEGHPGWTITQLDTHLRTNLPGWMGANTPAYVLLHAGTNDAGAGRTSAQMLTDMGALLDTIHRLSPYSTVLVAQIPEVPYNGAAQNAQLRAYDDGIPGLATARRPWASVVDMRGVHISADGVHPDDAGYADMARRWKAALPEVRAA